MPKLTPAKITKLAARRREVMSEIDKLTKEKAQIDAQLEALEPGHIYEAGDLVISRNPVRGLDSPLIEKTFPASRFPEYYKLTLDTAEFKKHFSAIDLENFQKISYRISIKEA